MNADLALLTGQYMTFKLQKENYGIEIIKVQEIIGMQKVTAIPQTPHVRGVINLRGRVIPVVDLRYRFNLNSTEDSEKTVIIIVNFQNNSEIKTTGLVVDEVSEVLQLPESALEQVPQFDGGEKTEYISSIGKVEELVVMILNVEKVLDQADLSTAAN
jgi:purine-binding chemotaxis protein CheW